MELSLSTKKNVAIIMIIGFLCIALFTIYQFWNFDHISEFNISKLTKEDANFSIDDISYNDSYINITGWCAIPGENLEIVNNRILLKNINTNIYYEIKSSAYLREDVTEYYKDNFDYNFSGLMGKVAKRYLNLDEYSYQIYILYQSNSRWNIVETQSIISK